jgi:alkaline phosphatase
MSQPARPAAARAPRARDWPAPPPPAHPQHRSPARQRITTAGLAPAQPMTTGSAATTTRPQISVRLPASDWQIQWRRKPDGRTILEVTDQAGNLTGLAASTRLPIVSVDGA